MAIEHCETLLVSYILIRCCDLHNSPIPITVPVTVFDVGCVCLSDCLSDSLYRFDGHFDLLYDGGVYGMVVSGVMIIFYHILPPNPIYQL